MGIGSFLFGSAGTTGKAGPLEGNLKQGAAYSLGNVMGAKYIGDKKGTPQFDYSGVNKRIGMPEAIKDYDLSGFNDAASGLKLAADRAAGRTAERINPFKFNYADPSVLNEYAANQYGLGASDIRREGAGNLDRIRESIGVRRPGLLLKAGEKSGRNTTEQLARLNATLRGDVLGRQTDLNRAQQEAQAAEDLNAANFNQNAEGNNLTNILNAYKALGDVTQNRAATQGSITESERGYQGDNLNRLLQLYMDIHGRRKGSPKGAKTGILGPVLNAGAQIGSAFIPTPKAK